MTKRVYEVAKDYGVSAKEVIKTLSEHNIKVGNFSGVDETMKSVLDRAYSTKNRLSRRRLMRRKTTDIILKISLLHPIVQRNRSTRRTVLISSTRETRTMETRI